MRLNNLHTLRNNHRSRRSNRSMHRNKYSLLPSRNQQQDRKISDRLRYTEFKRELQDWRGRARRILFFGLMSTQTSPNSELRNTEMFAVHTQNSSDSRSI
jgi:C4-dicarboxylate-specific signal transduction histidine kinase